MDVLKNKKRKKQWEEVEEYRSLLEVPEKFEEGFTLRTVLGVLFISLIMTPGEMYLGLFTGGGIGAAAQWVTVILFMEVAKRSFASLRRQEIYLLVYVATALVVREEGAFLDLLFRQYFVRSAEAEMFGISKILPWWYVPSPDSEAIAERTFLHRDWLYPILLLVVGTIMGRIAWFTSGYMLFRLTSDREQLPFPTAPMSAMASMALAEESGDEKETWKWPVFSIGTAIGAVFGVVYVLIPAVTQIWGDRVEIIPIPFWDLTPYLGNVLPATPIGIALNLGPIFTGLLMPFWSVIGSFCGVVIHTIAGPILHDLGFLPRWEIGMDTIRTQIATGIDFWKAFSIGISLAVTAVSFYSLIAIAKEKREDSEEKERRREISPLINHVCKHGDCKQAAQVRGFCLKHLGRGDFNLWICGALFAVAALYPIFLAKLLFPTLMSTWLLIVFLIIAFVYAPIMSFVSARMDGLVGNTITIPYVDEAIRFLTGFRGVEIWFVPFPARNFGGHAEGFRIVELTGMRFTSLLKAEVFMLPIVLGVSLMYWTFLWRLAPIPSESYPYAQLMWPLQAFDRALYLSSTMYSKMWNEGEEVDGKLVGSGEVIWSPSNLQDQRWWYWRVAETKDSHILDPAKRNYGEWSETGYFYTDYSGENLSGKESFSTPVDLPTNTSKSLRGPELLWPPNGEIVTTPNPNFFVRTRGSVGDSTLFYFEIDRLPSFDGEFLQRSSDRPLLFEVLWEDLRFTRDQIDNDNDGLVDEEVVNGKDDDGDGKIDEDIHHPLSGKKWPIIAFGAGFGIFGYMVLSLLGMPIFLIWGYVQSVNAIPYYILPQIIGALLGRYYFWNRYGKQEWRRYAMVLTVGFGVGMSLIGMFAAALAMITKAVSSLQY
ncbi:MAG: hypothetical protein VX294_10195 [Candidatus Latescibacterota bacterium]|nr:hypothetical protein [Candidatus Latescibacterota bacterium]